jgi:hypothetical protein
MSEFTVPKADRWFRELGRYDNIQIEPGDERVVCTVTDDETVMVARVDGHTHAWQETERGYQTVCHHMGFAAYGLLSDVKYKLIERVPCDDCRHELEHSADASQRQTCK